MHQQHTLLGFIAFLVSGFFVVYYFSLPVLVINLGITDQRHHHSLQLANHYKPKTITPQAPPDEADFIDPSIVLDQQDAHFVVPIAHLAATSMQSPQSFTAILPIQATLGLSWMPSASAQM